MLRLRAARAIELKKHAYQLASYQQVAVSRPEQAESQIDGMKLDHA
jgi:hypothetical protein